MCPGKVWPFLLSGTSRACPGKMNCVASRFSLVSSEGVVSNRAASAGSVSRSRTCKQTALSYKPASWIEPEEVLASQDSNKILTFYFWVDPSFSYTYRELHGIGTY